MPIVISELVFKAEIATPSKRRLPDRGQASRSETDQRVLVEACVEEVMRILERKKER